MWKVQMTLTIPKHFPSHIVLYLHIEIALKWSHHTLMTIDQHRTKQKSKKTYVTSKRDACKSEQNYTKRRAKNELTQMRLDNLEKTLRKRF